MELGNILFGNSRGSFSIERGQGYEQELARLFDVCAPDRDTNLRDYGVDFENDTFHVFPYYWGDCTCGYDEFESEWCEHNHHAEDCYQTKLRTAVAAYDAQIGYELPGSLLECFDVEAEKVQRGVSVLSFIPNAIKRDLGKLHSAFEEETQRRLCQEMNLSYPKGCAVHCTCDYEERWATWSAENSHRPDCLLERPNFLYKPTGFSIEWYKYPLRDSYMSKNLNLQEFRKIIDACIASLTM